MTATAVALAWQASAACRGHNPETWFPHIVPNTSRDQWETARLICSGCPVAAECLDDALTHERAAGKRYGMRGGMTPEQRRRIAKKREATP